MDESVLVTLAILNVNWDESGISYIQNFVPFVADCLRQLSGSAVSIDDLQAAVATTYGIQLPQAALKSIVSKAARDGLLRREQHQIVPDRQALEAYDLSDRRLQLVRQHEALVDKFHRFCADEMGAEVSRDDASASLLAFIEDRSLPVLRAATRGYSPPDPELLDTGKREYLVSSFIAWVFERDPDAFDYLMSIVKGSMLATALYLPNSGDAGRKLTSLHIYLDTPFLLHALGWHDEASESAAHELMSLLQTLGARLACFSHTADEVRNVLLASMRTLASGRRRGEKPSGSAVVQNCVARGLGPSELERRAEKLERDLDQMGIAVRQSTDYNVRTTVDENLLEKILEKFIRYQSPDARLYDLKSITSVFRLRHGKAVRDLDAAKAIFATPNVKLVKASREFFRERPEGDTVPVCVVDYELATVAWLRSPVSSPDLPRKQVLADVHAALNPEDKLWRRYIEEVDRLADDEKLSDEDYYVLRFSVEARRALMRVTMGDEHDFTAGTIADVLKAAHEEQQADLIGQLREARSETARERAERLAAVDNATRAHAAADRLLERSRRKRRLTADRLGHIAGLGLSVILGVVAMICVVLALPKPFPSLIDGASALVVWAVAVVFAVGAALSVLNMWLGTSIRDVERKFENWVGDRIFRWMERNLDAEDGELEH